VPPCVLRPGHRGSGGTRFLEGRAGCGAAAGTGGGRHRTVGSSPAAAAPAREVTVERIYEQPRFCIDLRSSYL
jgi:hypothetical protein